jgi:fatty-acyl-CoA synthase
MGAKDVSEGHRTTGPKGLPERVTCPATDLFFNVEVAARRFPDKPYLLYYDTPVTFRRFKDEVERIAGWLEQRGVRVGDRVLLYMQNCPQFVIGYYAIIRANAVVVPVNPMNLTGELRPYITDTDAKVALVAQELSDQIKPFLGAGLEALLVTAYSDYLKVVTDLALPDVVASPQRTVAGPGVFLWHAALALNLRPGPVKAGPDDLCVLPYTSGSGGLPKGCRHTHRSIMSNLVAGVVWFSAVADSVFLATLPFFHVTGMQFSMNGPLYAGSTVVLLTRWDRRVAAKCIERYRVTSWTAIPTMLVDFLTNPEIDSYDLSSLRFVSGGGAAMPEAIAREMADRGIPYVEGYGLTETIAQSHLNRPERPLGQCLGIPVFQTESMVVDPVTLDVRPVNEPGEILIRGPQLFSGYWRDPAATQAAFVDIDGKTWFRTGDVGRIDEEGNFFFVDRLKRMINASGFKVSPAEVESALYHHPAIKEACVVAAKDSHRGETVKALIVLKEGRVGAVGEQDIVIWARERMAAYKAPRIVEFVESLPKSGTGKIAWRLLQDRELNP